MSDDNAELAATVLEIGRGVCSLQRAFISVSAAQTDNHCRMLAMMALLDALALTHPDLEGLLAAHRSRTESLANLLGDANQNLRAVEYALEAYNRLHRLLQERGG